VLTLVFQYTLTRTVTSRSVPPLAAVVAHSITGCVVWKMAVEKWTSGTASESPNCPSCCGPATGWTVPLGKFEDVHCCSVE